MATKSITTNPLTGKPLGPQWLQIAAMMQRHGITLVVDVGANIGQYAAALRASGYRGRILSVEPLADAHARLAAAAARDADWIVADRAALGAAPGRLTINVSANSDMSSALAFTAEAQRVFDSDRFVTRESVELTTVDAVLGVYARPTDRIFLKSDTQGYDLEVLRGAAAGLRIIEGVQFEASLHPIYEGEPDWRTVVDFTESYGFAVHLVIPGYFSRAYCRMLAMDLVLFRDPAPAQRQSVKSAAPGPVPVLRI
jgi:FkbM family methyltransferase